MLNFKSALLDEDTVRLVILLSKSEITISHQSVFQTYRAIIRLIRLKTDSDLSK